jgi:G3E family GTPase
VRIDSIVAVVDAEQLAELDFHHEPMALHQLVTADLVILNKLDLVDEAAKAKVEAKVRGTVPDARILEAVRGDVPYELVMGGERFDPERLADHDHDHDHDHGEAFETFAWTSERPLSLEKLRDVLDELPAGIVRAKGIVAIDGLAERRVVVHVAGKRIFLEQGNPWGDAARHSRLVAIGTRGSFDPAALEAALRGCEVEPGRGVGRTLLGWVRGLKR